MAGTPTTATLCSAASQYSPIAVKGLKQGETKNWCRCGLTKTEPWCDGSHHGTGIKKLRWTVEKTQAVYNICACKQTKTPPFCDGSHVLAKEIVDERQKNCTRKDGHKTNCKLCTGCGWVPDL